MMRFGKEGKLSPLYIDPSEVLERVGEVAYRLALLLGLSGVHPVFHVSILQKYCEDQSYILDFILVQLDKNLAYEEEPVAILDRQVWKLRSNDIALVKVQWRGQPVDEATWEAELDMKSRYPHLFDIPCMIRF
ncbi:uncharacterized protein LOC142168924 [Nicotiana tabacum]|uniref:Uncharacterized protein LOC142168924 n=1 Tax=Nicotiana tabacum TaxID=4097 RepID=A0AC58SMJ8_TOBAC